MTFKIHLKKHLVPPGSAPVHQSRPTAAQRTGHPSPGQSEDLGWCPASVNLPVVWPWINSLISLSLRSPIYKLGLKIPFSLEYTGDNRWGSIREMITWAGPGCYRVGRGAKLAQEMGDDLRGSSPRQPKDTLAVALYWLFHPDLAWLSGFHAGSEWDGWIF